MNIFLCITHQPEDNDWKLVLIGKNVPLNLEGDIGKSVIQAADEGGGQEVANCTVMKNRFENHHYNKALRPYASCLRKEMTKAEACLWKYILRARQLKG